ncbi:hypothetical protein M8818_004680 [Zalaria obscura]|uniref:Uncharacterized protein n=1 Tax=Zalaria obscura TaxID=2024903 RepID=A0ACC3SBU6_9PEZI
MRTPTGPEEPNTWGSKFFRPSDHTDSWGRRDHSPALDWKKPWTQDTFANGRVLIIDYVSNGNGHNGHISEMHSTSRRKVCATEFENLHSLKTFYSNPDLPQAAFRLIHVQNAGWATEFLLEKFNIAHGDELTGTTFAKRVQYERPEQRHGKPFPSGQSWRPTRVRDRNLSYTSYSLDFLRSAVIDNEERALEANKHKGIHDAKIMELNTYHEGSEGAGVDVYVQRFSIHVQLNTPPEEYSPGASSYSRVQTMTHDSPDGTRSANIPGADSRRGSTSSGPMPPTKGSNSSHIAGSTSLAMERSKSDPKYDNTNAIIIFEASPSGDSKDTLIPARNELE